jgi:hypothetical protein
MGDLTPHPGNRGSTFPRLERYLARLPQGLASHPECVARASVYRVFCESRSLRGFAWNEVPARIAELLRTPVDPSAWVSEALTQATILAVADHLRFDDAETVAWFRECNAKVLNHPLYVALMTVSSPSLLVRYGARRWNALHRGVGFGVELHDGSAEATLTFPPFLYNDVILRGQGEGISTALTMSRAKNVRYQILRETPRSCSYRFDWE